MSTKESASLFDLKRSVIFILSPIKQENLAVDRYLLDGESNNLNETEKGF